MIKNSFLAKWDKPTLYLYLGGIALLLVCTALFSYHYYIGTEGHLDWYITSESESLEVTFYSFQELFHNHPINGNSYVMYEKFHGSPQPIDVYSSKLYFGFLVVAFAMALTAITHIKNQIIFFLSMLGVFASIVLLQLETLELTGLDGIKAPGLLIIVYGIACYSIRSFASQLSTLARFTAMLILTIGVSFLYGSLSGIPYPALHVTNAGHIPLGVCVAAFILMVSFDIINGFFYLSTQGKSLKPSSNIRNFILISSLYLASLMLLFLRKYQVIDWELNFIDPLYLLVISAIVGIWSHRERMKRFEKYIPYKGGSSLFYIALGLICFSTIFYAFATANDGFVKAYKDLVLYSHLYIGLIFFVYALINFFPHMQKNLPAHKVIYDPPFIPLLFVRLVGIGTVFIIILRSQYVSVKYWRSGYYSLWGDLYKKQSEYYEDKGQLALAEKNRQFSKTYYYEGFVYHHYNHKATYNLALMEWEDFYASNDYSKVEDATKYYDYMISSEFATPHSYVNYSNFIWDNQHNSNQERKILLKALRRFPDNGQIQNNLALTYRDYPVFRDSVEYHLNEAYHKTVSDFVPTTNLISYHLQYGSKKIADSLITQNQDLEYRPFIINAITHCNLMGKKYKQDIDKKALEDSILTNEEFMLINNYALNHIEDLDTSVINIKKFLNHSENQYLQDELIELNAHVQMNSGNKFDGKYDLSYLEEKSTDLERVRFQKILGKYMLREGDLVGAYEWFEKARETEKFQFKTDAQFYEAMIRGRLGQKKEAYPLLQSIVAIDTNNLYASARAMYVALETEYNDSVQVSTDLEKLWFVAFNLTTFSNPHVYALSTISDPDLKAQLIAMVIPELTKRDRTEDAITLLEYLPTEFNKNRSKQELNYAQLRILEKQKDAEQILEYLKSPDLSPTKQKYIPYFKAVAYEIKEDKKRAIEYYKKALKTSSFDEQTLTRGIRYIADNSNDPELSYNLVQKATESSPESVPITQLYVYVCVKNLYFRLADTGLEELEYMMEEAEFKQFKSEMEQLKSIVMEIEGLN